MSQTFRKSPLCPVQTPRTQLIDCAVLILPRLPLQGHGDVRNADGHGEAVSKSRAPRGGCAWRAKLEKRRSRGDPLRGPCVALRCKYATALIPLASHSCQQDVVECLVEVWENEESW